MVVVRIMDSDSTLVEAMRIPRMAKACISALHEDNDHNGLKTLRLVRKDMEEALLQCIEKYTLRFNLNLGLYPEALDAVTLLNRTRLSSLRVIINISCRHGECCWPWPRLANPQRGLWGRPHLPRFHYQSHGQYPQTLTRPR